MGQTQEYYTNYITREEAVMGETQAVYQTGYAQPVQREVVQQVAYPGVMQYGAPMVTQAPVMQYGAPVMQYGAPVSPVATSGFNAIDTNHDGNISRQEFA